jgi:hypothetical protein
MPVYNDRVGFTAQERPPISKSERAVAQKAQMSRLFASMKYTSRDPPFDNRRSQKTMSNK